MEPTGPAPPLGPLPTLTPRSHGTPFAVPDQCLPRVPWPKMVLLCSGLSARCLAPPIPFPSLWQTSAHPSGLSPRVPAPSPCPAGSEVPPRAPRGPFHTSACSVLLCLVSHRHQQSRDRRKLGAMSWGLFLRTTCWCLPSDVSTRQS